MAVRNNNDRDCRRMSRRPPGTAARISSIVVDTATIAERRVEIHNGALSARCRTLAIQNESCRDDVVDVGVVTQPGPPVSSFRRCRTSAGCWVTNAETAAVFIRRTFGSGAGEQRELCNPGAFRRSVLARRALEFRWYADGKSEHDQRIRRGHASVAVDVADTEFASLAAKCRTQDEQGIPRGDGIAVAQWLSTIAPCTTCIVGCRHEQNEGRSDRTTNQNHRA
jgi:hypothetical protein